MFTRAADIPEYVADGAADIGITGKDLIAEKEELKKQLKEGKITQKEYDYKVHETDDKHAGLDYQIAQARSRITL